MKHLLFFIMATLCSLTAAANAPVYHPFCEVGKVWTTDYDWHWVGGDFTHDVRRMQGDTIIAGQTCKKMLVKVRYGDEYGYAGAFYDDGPRVMYFASGSTEARLVYDFSLQVGDDVEVWPIGGSSYCTLHVVEVGTFVYDTHSFRELSLEGKDPEGNEIYATWVEGIGGYVSPMINVSFGNGAWGMSTSKLRSCSVGDEMLYFNEPNHKSEGEAINSSLYHYVPFAEEGKHWAVRHPATNAGGANLIVEYAMHGDTIISGLTAKRMYELDEDRVEQYVGAFFDRGHLTYFIAPGTTKAHLYYNFCASCSYGGDCTRVWHAGAYAQLYACTCADGVKRFPDSFTRFAHPDIDGVDMFLQHTVLGFVEFEDRDAAYNETYGLKNNHVYQDVYHQEWWEGIGSTLGPMHNWEYPELDLPYGKELIACWTPDRILYDPEDYIGLCEVKEQAAACRIWREGSTWEYYDEEGKLADTYTLGAYAKNYDRYYMPLIKNGITVEGFIRTERGDSLVYARGWRDSGDLLPEVLLYDFTKSYESGDVMRLGAAKSNNGGLGIDELCIESSNDAPLTFFYDVFEDGDRIPQWNGFIYKVGCLEGPMAYFYGQVSDKKPSAKNLSHLIFGNKKRKKAPTKFFPFGNAYNVFAFDFFDRLCETSDADEAAGNVVASPLSAQFALSMLQNGAAGNTLKEMQFALGTSAYTVDEVNAYNRALIDKLQQPIVLSNEWRAELESLNKMAEEYGKYPEFSDIKPANIDDLMPKMEVANGIWTAPWLPVNDAFFTTNATNYDAAAETADFSQQSTMDAIDRWVADKTHGTIPSINEEPNDEIVMMLINTLFFRGSWEDRFEYTDDKGVFTNADGSRVITPLMYNWEDKERAETDNFKMVRVTYAPYSDNYEVGCDQVKYRMGLYLPKYDGAVLTTSEWQRLGVDAVKGRTTLIMPRFSVAQELELNDVLKAMGMQEAFDKRHANFSALSSDGTFVSKVKQLCNITVDERGTTAAAATVVISVPTGIDTRVPFEMTIDHPFYFTIETSDGDILFIGRVSQLDGPPAPDGISAPHVELSATSTYDLFGRRITKSQTPHGVYVVNGKKVIR